MLPFILTSCSDDMDNSDIVGTWYATVNGGKASVELTFNSDKTGNLHYCWDNVIYRVVDYSFTYSVSGSSIKTSGVAVDSDGIVSDKTMTFTYADGKITGGQWVTDNGYSKY